MEFYNPKQDNHLKAETRYAMITERGICPECRVELKKTERGLFCPKCKLIKATLTLYEETPKR